MEHLREQWRKLASKDTAYRGVSLPLTAKQGEQILEALAKRQTNVAARLIIDAMAETVKNHWWSAGTQESDEAGRWWSSNASEAREYSMSDEDAWMTLPVFMEASFEGADKAATSYSDGTYVWHLDSGHPVTITSFEAILPDDPQHLLDAWRGIISEGNYDAPGTRWDGVWTKLNIPPMRTSAALSVGGGTYWRMHPVGRPFDVTDARSTDFGPAPQTRTGYSCVANPWHLFVYTEVMGWFDFRGGRSVVSESDVIAFTGHEMSRRGADGEPLVKPDSLVERYSWGQFVPELLSTPFGEFWAPRSKRLRSWEDFALDRPPGAWIGSSPRALLTKAVLAQFAPGKLAQEQEWSR